MTRWRLVRSSPPQVPPAQKVFQCPIIIPLPSAGQGGPGHRALLLRLLREGADDVPQDQQVQCSTVQYSTVQYSIQYKINRQRQSTAYDEWIGRCEETIKAFLLASNIEVDTVAGEKARYHTPSARINHPSVHNEHPSAPNNPPSARNYPPSVRNHHPSARNTIRPKHPSNLVPKSSMCN